MEYKASQELLLDSEDPEVSFIAIGYSMYKQINLSSSGEKTTPFYIHFLNSFQCYVFIKGRLGGHPPFRRGGRGTCTGGRLHNV